MMIQTDKKYYTPEEYLELEEQAEYKSEYHEGEIISMTGGTANHNKIAGNFYGKFLITVNPQEYEIYINDIRLSIPEYNLYAYPDIMIVKGKPIYEKNSKTTVINPLVIVEVLSQSTQAYDRTKKFKFYRSISTLAEYILVDQYSFSVEQYIKQSEEKWLCSYCDEEEAVLTLSSVDFEISLTNLYARVEFDLDE